MFENSLVSAKSLELARRLMEDDIVAEFYEFRMAMSSVAAFENLPPVFERSYGDDDELAINPD